MSAARAILRYGIWISSAMMKAPAPMIGGMIWPPVDATASTAAANAGRKPSFFIIGIVKAPVVTTLAEALPEIVPNKALATVATLAGPPRNRPAARIESSRKPVPPPVSPTKAPRNTKMAMMLAEIPVSCPQIPPVVR